MDRRALAHTHPHTLTNSYMKEKPTVENEKKRCDRILSMVKCACDVFCVIVAHMSRRRTCLVHHQPTITWRNILMNTINVMAYALTAIIAPLFDSVFSASQELAQQQFNCELVARFAAAFNFFPLSRHAYVRPSNPSAVRRTVSVIYSLSFDSVFFL